MFKISAGLWCVSPKFINCIGPSIYNSSCSLTKNKLDITNDSEVKENKRWDILSAVCIERTPVITRALNKLEEQVVTLFERIEIENSCKSNFELKYQEEKAQLEKWKKTNVGQPLEEEEATIPSQDYIDKNTEELKNYQFAPRTTEADQKNDIKSLERRLDSYLLLVIKKKLGDKSLWHLPQDKNREDETLRQTAERIVKETFGDELQVKFRGNAPAGFYKYKYPTTIRGKEDQPIGAKVFFYKAKYLGGSFQPKNYEDFQWATRSELNKLFLPLYHKSVSMFLIDEENNDTTLGS